MANEYNFKPITEAEYLEEVPEGATVLVESGGEIKRVPRDGFGGSNFKVARIHLTQNIDGHYVDYGCDTNFDELRSGILEGNILLIVDELSESEGCHIFYYPRIRIFEDNLELSDEGFSLCVDANGIVMPS